MNGTPFSVHISLLSSAEDLIGPFYSGLSLIRYVSLLIFHYSPAVNEYNQETSNTRNDIIFSSYLFRYYLGPCNIASIIGRS